MYTDRKIVYEGANTIKIGMPVQYITGMYIWQDLNDRNPLKIESPTI